MLNKADIADGEAFQRLRMLYPGSVAISAETGVGIDGLPQKLSEAAVNGSRFITSPALPAWHRPHDLLTS